MRPDAVAVVDVAGLGELTPQGRRLADLAGTQLESDERRERLLGRTAGRATSTHGLGERGGARDAIRKCL